MPGNQSVEYILPQAELEEYRADLDVGVWILIGITVLAASLGLLGMLVEFTALGNIKHSHEETNFANIDIPMLQEGDGKSQRQQLNQILLVKDELLRNSKNLWATFLLCFSFTRNVRTLFYKFKMQHERIKHRSAMYAVWVFGFGWFALYVSCQIGLHSFPMNFFQLPVDMTDWTYSIVHGGQMFGLNLMYLAWGYITAVNFLNFSNYLPADLFSSLTVRWTCKKDRS